MNPMHEQGDELSLTDEKNQPRLADEAALDALVNAHFDLSKVEIGVRERAERAAKVLGLLNADHISCDRSLVDVTMQRIVRRTEPELTSADTEALDAWALSGYDAQRTPGSLRQRAQRHEALAANVTDSDLVATPLLVERTFQAVAAQVASDRSQGIQMQTRRSWRMADMLSVAAMILLGVSVLWPTMTYVSRKGRELSCHSNLGTVASAMGLYAGNHRDALPVATAGFGGSSPWWHVSPEKPQSNAANLYTLARTKYAKLRDLACAGNPKAELADVKPGTYDWSNFENVSYSYQIMGGPVRPNWHRDAAAPAKIVVLADRSPVVIRARNLQPIDPLENSPNHQGRGQFVLLADGSVLWMTSPERAGVNGAPGDNIWLPLQIEVIIRQAAKAHQTGRLEGCELPDNINDSFVGP